MSTPWQTASLVGGPHQPQTVMSLYKAAPPAQTPPTKPSGHHAHLCHQVGWCAAASTLPRHSAVAFQQMLLQLIPVYPT